MTIEQTILAYSTKMSDGYHRIHDYLGLISALEGREEQEKKRYVDKMEILFYSSVSIEDSEYVENLWNEYKTKNQI